MAYDSKATRERILAAATAEFAGHGIAGARIDRIASAACANKRAIYDYFGDKEALFGAVLEAQLSQCAEVASVEDGDIVSYAERLVDYHATHPEALRLLLWEALEFGEREVPAEAARRRLYQRRVEAIASSKAPCADPNALVFFALGLANWGFAVPQLRRMILGEGCPRERLRAAVAVAVRTLAAGEG